LNACSASRRRPSFMSACAHAAWGGGKQGGKEG
jgi:hypothetical protein